MVCRDAPRTFARELRGVEESPRSSCFKRGKAYLHEAFPDPPRQNTLCPVRSTSYELIPQRRDVLFQKCELLRHVPSRSVSERHKPFIDVGPRRCLVVTQPCMNFWLNTPHMLANLHFCEYRHIGVHVHHDEGTVLGVDPPTHEEIPLAEASTAPRRFDQAAAKTLDLTDLLLPTDASELAQPGTANYQPNTAFVMMAIDGSNLELEDIGTGIVEVFEEFGIEAITAGEFDPGEVITDRILSEIETREFLIADLTLERVLRGRARARPEQARDSGAEEGHESALRPVPPQLPGIR